MNQYIKNKSINFKKTSTEATRLLLENRLSTSLSKQQKISSSIFFHRFNSSGSGIHRQKNLNTQEQKELYKSADIAYFIEKQRDSTSKDQQETKDANYAYIGQIQALQRRKIGRKKFFRQFNSDKSNQKQSYLELSTEKTNQLSKLDNISVNYLKGNPTDKFKQRASDIQVEELHYTMVLTYQKCKKKYNY